MEEIRRTLSPVRVGWGMTCLRRSLVATAGTAGENMGFSDFLAVMLQGAQTQMQANS